MLPYELDYEPSFCKEIFEIGRVKVEVSDDVPRDVLHCADEARVRQLVDDFDQQLLADIESEPLKLLHDDSKALRQFAEVYHLSDVLEGEVLTLLLPGGDWLHGVQKWRGVHVVAQSSVRRSSPHRQVKV